MSIVNYKEFSDKYYSMSDAPCGLDYSSVVVAGKGHYFVPNGSMVVVKDLSFKSYYPGTRVVRESNYGWHVRSLKHNVLIHPVRLFDDDIKRFLKESSSVVDKTVERWALVYLAKTNRDDSMENIYFFVKYNDLKLLDTSYIVYPEHQGVDSVFYLGFNVQEDGIWKYNGREWRKTLGV